MQSLPMTRSNWLELHYTTVARLSIIHEYQNETVNTRTRTSGRRYRYSIHTIIWVDVLCNFGNSLKPIEISVTV